MRKATSQPHTRSHTLVHTRSRALYESFWRHISSHVSKRSAVIFSPCLWSDYRSTWPPESEQQPGHGLKWVSVGPVGLLSVWSVCPLMIWVADILPFVSLVWSAYCQVLLSTKVRGERRRGQARGPGAWEGLEFHESRKCFNWIAEFTDQSRRLTVRDLRCVLVRFVWEHVRLGTVKLVFVFISTNNNEVTLNTSHSVLAFLISSVK